MKREGVRGVRRNRERRREGVGEGEEWGKEEQEGRVGKGGRGKE